MSHFLFLCSDFGWSVYRPTVGEKIMDPAKVSRARQGVPTSSESKERKSRIRDGSGAFYNWTGYPDVYPLTRGPEYVPKLCAKILTRKEYWSSQAKEFAAFIYVSVQPSPEWRQHMTTPIDSFDEFTSYRAMNDSLWRTFSTPSCNHSEVEHYERPVKLGPDAIVLTGWSNAFEVLEACPERVLIFQTRSSLAIRWLAVKAGTRGRLVMPHRREVMLRTPTCCDECALEHTASMPGRWSLIL
jgi:hypothetical protein